MLKEIALTAMLAAASPVASASGRPDAETASVPDDKSLGEIMSDGEIARVCNSIATGARLGVGDALNGFGVYNGVVGSAQELGGSVEADCLKQVGVLVERELSHERERSENALASQRIGTFIAFVLLTASVIAGSIISHNLRGLRRGEKSGKEEAMRSENLP